MNAPRVGPHNGKPFTGRGLKIGIITAARAFGLSDADRYEIASILLDRNVESYNDLDPAELDRMWYAFNGAVLVAYLLMERRKRERA
jgi:hypothetical protein